MLMSCTRVRTCCLRRPVVARYEQTLWEAIRANEQVEAWVDRLARPTSEHPLQSDDMPEAMWQPLRAVVNLATAQFVANGLQGPAGSAKDEEAATAATQSSIADKYGSVAAMAQRARKQASKQPTW